MKLIKKKKKKVGVSSISIIWSLKQASKASLNKRNLGKKKELANKTEGGPIYEVDKQNINQSYDRYNKARSRYFQFFQMVAPLLRLGEVYICIYTWRRTYVATPSLPSPCGAAPFHATRSPNLICPASNRESLFKVTVTQKFDHPSFLCLVA